MTEKQLEKLKEHWSMEVQFVGRDILPKNFSATQISNLDEAGQQLLMHTVLSGIMVPRSRDDEARNDFIKFCRSTYQNKRKFPEQLETFCNTYESKDAIKWYTKPNSFIHRLVSKVSASTNIDDWTSIRFYLGDLYQNLKALHKDQVETYFQDDVMVYRGVRLSMDEFRRVGNEGSLFITRGFLSTTVDETIAKIFADDTASDNDHVCVIFCMTIESIEVQTKPIAYIASDSFRADESEIMLSMGMVFRTVSVEEASDSNHKKINMIRGKDERSIEKDLLQISNMLQAGTECLLLGTNIFLATTPNGRHLGESIASISRVLNASHLPVTQQLLPVSETNVIDTQVSIFISF